MSRRLRGITLKLAAVLVFMVMAALIKATAVNIPPGEAVFFRSFFAIPVIVVWLIWQGELATGLRVKSYAGHLKRGICGSAAMVLGFGALGMLPLPEVTAIGYASPLFTVMLAAWMLRESVRLVRWTAVIVGLLGVLIVLSPRLTALDNEFEMLAAYGALFALGSAALRSLSQIFLRQVVASETTAAVVFYFSAISTLVSLTTIPFGWAVPTALEAAMLVGAGLLGGLGQILLTSAYRHSQASVIAPLDYASMLFALAIGYFAFGEVPSLVMLSGALVVISSGVLIIWRESRLGLPRGQARALKAPFG